MGIRLQVPGVEFSVAKSERKLMATMRQRCDDFSQNSTSYESSSRQVAMENTMAPARLKSPV